MNTPSEIPSTHDAIEARLVEIAGMQHRLNLERARLETALKTKQPAITNIPLSAAATLILGKQGLGFRDSHQFVEYTRSQLLHQIGLLNARRKAVGKSEFSDAEIAAALDEVSVILKEEKPTPVAA